MFFVKPLIFTFLLFFSGMSSGGQPNFAPPDPKLIKTESMTGTLKKDLNNNVPCKLRRITRPRLAIQKNLDNWVLFEVEY